jgi:hypothetical protein
MDTDAFNDSDWFDGKNWQENIYFKISSIVFRKLGTSMGLVI